MLLSRRNLQSYHPLLIIIVIFVLLFDYVISDNNNVDDVKACELVKYGTIYGGWKLPIDINLTSSSVIYSAGVGEDISFDIMMSEKYQSNLVLIDPTERSYQHYIEILNYYNNNRTGIFSAIIQQDYNHILQSSNPNLNVIKYIKKGLWYKKDRLKFYKPNNDNYVSHTLIENMYSDKYYIVDVDSIKNIMTELNHYHIDLLKLDIEGSEVIVLEQMIHDNIFPKYLCIEFDLVKQQIDHNQITAKMIDKLDLYGYKMIDNDNNNCLFELRK